MSLKKTLTKRTVFQKDIELTRTVKRSPPACEIRADFLPSPYEKLGIDS